MLESVLVGKGEVEVVFGVVVLAFDGADRAGCIEIDGEIGGAGGGGVEEVEGGLLAFGEGVVVVFGSASAVEGGAEGENGGFFDGAGDGAVGKGDGVAAAEDGVAAGFGAGDERGVEAGVLGTVVIVVEEGDVFGDGVNVAARLEPLAPPGGIAVSGVVRDQAITAADWYPTISDLCGLDQPKVKLDGQSLLKIIKSPKTPTHHKVMHWQWGNKWAVRQGDWKLLGSGAKGRSLGNLSGENPESENFIKTKPEIATRLLDLHLKWAREVKPKG